MEKGKQLELYIRHAFGQNSDTKAKELKKIFFLGRLHILEYYVVSVLFTLTGMTAGSLLAMAQCLNPQAVYLK